MYWFWNLYPPVIFVVLFVQLIDSAWKYICCFLIYQVQITRSRDTEPYLYRTNISCYVFNFSYMMNIMPKLFNNESPAHHPLIFTQGCGTVQIIMIRKYVYFIAKENSSELLKAFHYWEKFLISSSVVTLRLAQYYWEEGNWIIVLNDNSTCLFIRDISLNSE